MHENSPIKINKVKNRFLPISKSVRMYLEPEPKISDFEIIKEIGRGTFGRVLLVRHKESHINYAIKVIDKSNKENIEGKLYFRREIEIMYKLHHNNCVRLFGHFEDEINCYFIMEYLPNGNLYSYMKKNKLIEPSKVASFMKDLISAIYYLHNMSPPIIHRDIKPENILLNENNIIKLTDFGWSNYINDSGEERLTLCGTPLYFAPEMLEKKGHDYKVDIWCIGVLMFELLVGKPPFIGKDIKMTLNNIINCKIAWPKIIDEDAKNLIEIILNKEPKMRPSLKDIINHKFFKKFYSNPEEFLIKGNEDLNERPYVISKDNPNQYNEINKKIYDKSNRNIIVRDISPVPRKRLKIENINNNNNYMNGNNINSAFGNKNNNDSSSFLEIELSSWKKNYENLYSTFSMVQKENSKNMEQIKKNKTYINKLEKENEIKDKEIKIKDDEIIQLKDRNIKQEALIISLQYTIESLKKEINNKKHKETITIRAKTPETIIYKRRNVGVNQRIESKHSLYNETLRKKKKNDEKISINKYKNNNLITSKSSSQFKFERHHTEENIDDKRRIKNRINGFETKHNY